MEPTGSRAAKQQLQNCSRRLAERQTRGGGCFHLAVFARPRCNNQPVLLQKHSAESWQQVTRSTSVYSIKVCYSAGLHRYSPSASTREAARSTAAWVTRKVPQQSLPLFAVNYHAHLWLQQHWQLSKARSVCLCVYFGQLSVQKTKRGPVGRLCIGLPVSTQSGPQWRICRPDRIKPPSLYTTVMRIRSLQSSGDSKVPLIYSSQTHRWAPWRAELSSSKSGYWCSVAVRPVNYAHS